MLYCGVCTTIPLRQQVRALKQTILEEAAGTSNGLKATPQQRDAISKAINGLAAANLTKDITTSELATGVLAFVRFHLRVESRGELATKVSLSASMVSSQCFSALLRLTHRNMGSNLHHHAGSVWW